MAKLGSYDRIGAQIFLLGAPVVEGDAGPVSGDLLAAVVMIVGQHPGHSNQAVYRPQA